MKKIYILTCMVLLLFCLVGCNEYTLNKLIKGGEINYVSVASLSALRTADIKIEELKEQPFYNNIMNSKLESIKTLPKTSLRWMMLLHNDTEVIEITYMDKLYAKYDESYYIIRCLEKDIKAMNDYIFRDYNKYKLIVEYLAPFMVEKLKDEYEAGEVVEVKMASMEYYPIKEVLYTRLYAFLNGKLIGKIDTSNTIKFIMPANNSVLTLSNTDDNIYRLDVKDNFELLTKPLKHYYKAGEKVVVTTKFLSGPRIDVKLNGKLLTTIQESYEDYECKYEFVMPSFNSRLVILMNTLEKAEH